MSPFYSTFYRILFLVAITFYSNNPLQASHILGVDWDNNCVSSTATTKTYAVNLKVYLDPNGASASPIRIYINGGNNCNTTVNVPAYVDISPAQGGYGAESLCFQWDSIYNFTAVQWYRTTITIPSHCGDYTLSYEPCCIIGGNIGSGASSGHPYYFSTILAGGAGVCNNGVEFGNSIVVEACSGEPFTYIPDGSDSDRDLLRYRIINPPTSDSTSLPYSTGLSVNRPIYTEPNTTVTLDSFTGAFTCTPEAGRLQPGVVITFRVDEIRNGVVINSTVRDIYLRVANCQQESIVLDSIVAVSDQGRVMASTDSIALNYCIGKPLELWYYVKDTFMGSALQFESGLSTIQQVFPQATYTTLPYPNSGASNSLILRIRIPHVRHRTFAVGFSNNNCYTRGAIYNSAIAADGLQCAQIYGYIAIDSNQNCIIDSNDIAYPHLFVHLTKGGFSTFVKPDTNGRYEFLVDTGTYSIYNTYFNPLLSACAGVATVSATHLSDSIQTDFAVQPIIVPPVNTTTPPNTSTSFTCPLMVVDLTCNAFVNCRDGVYVVNYRNLGTAIATNASVEVTLDPLYVVTNTNIPIYGGQNGNTYTYNIGNIPIGGIGSFYMYVTLDTTCDTTFFGRMLCAEAHIYPDTLCVSVDTLWTGANIEAEAICLDSIVGFRLVNRGTGIMSTSHDFYVLENSFLLDTQSYQLAAGDSTAWFYYPATGGAYRLETAQVLHHPWAGLVSVNIEGCYDTLLTGVTPPRGGVNVFSEDAIPPYLSVDCVRSRFSWDPNDKQANPVGFGAQHYIEANTSINYRIRFQNTGTAPALIVAIKDTLSNYLNPTTLRITGASHPFSWRIVDNNQLEVSFPNINLPDSGTNFLGSQGFVDYTIAQQPNNPVGSIIQNTAGIYFDSNPPVITNTIKHTIGEDFLLPVTQTIIDTVSCDGFSYNGQIYHQSIQQATVQNQPTGTHTNILRLVVNHSQDTTLVQQDCDSVVYNNVVYLQSGNYTQHLTTVGGCDSTVYLPILIESPSTLVSVFGTRLFAAVGNFDYQWVRCEPNGSFTPIGGATGQSYVPTTSGNYAVEVNNNICTKRSRCYNITITNQSTIQSQDDWRVYPNPTQDWLYVEQYSQQIATLQLFDQLGRRLQTKTINKDKQVLDMRSLASGVYYLSIESGSMVQQIKVVKK